MQCNRKKQPDLADNWYHGNQDNPDDFTCEIIPKCTEEGFAKQIEKKWNRQTCDSHNCWPAIGKYNSEDWVYRYNIQGPGL